jgi:hypothetical protein
VSCRGEEYGTEGQASSYNETEACISKSMYANFISGLVMFNQLKEVTCFYLIDAWWNLYTNYHSLLSHRER